VSAYICSASLNKQQSKMKTNTNIKNMGYTFTKSYVLIALTLLAIITSSASFGQTPIALPIVGTNKLLGKIDGIRIEVITQSPSAEKTPLQIACVFEYTENDIYSPPALPFAANGIAHLDKGLNGVITELRKSGAFTGHAFETLLIDIPNGTITPGRLLLIGLGDRKKFDVEMMKTIGKIEMREALRLGVNSYAHASDLKDGGVDSPTGLVAQNVLKGAISAYRTQNDLKSKKMSAFKSIKKITFLAGPPFYQITGDALKTTISDNGN
jgi:hypothetical protein